MQINLDDLKILSLAAEGYFNIQWGWKPVANPLSKELETLRETLDRIHEEIGRELRRVKESSTNDTAQRFIDAAKSTLKSWGKKEAKP